MTIKWLVGLAFAAIAVGGLAACGSESGTERTEASSLVEATDSPSPPPTVAAAAAPTPTAESLAIPTPTPLDVLTLAHAKAGVSGVNWVVQFPDTAPWEVFRAPSEDNPEPVELPAWVPTLTRAALVVDGSPDDDWVEIALPWQPSNAETGWMRATSDKLVSTTSVLEIQRSAGVLNVWADGEVIWTAQDLSDEERRVAHIPLVIGYVTGMTSQGTREHFHPQILGTSIALMDVEGENVSVLGIRGVDDGVSLDEAKSVLPPDAKGVSHWIRSSELDELAELLPIGTRIEVVE